MMNLEKIPKVMNFYWGFNSKLTYLNLLTLISFRKFNPDWVIVLYRPKQSSKFVLSDKIDDFHIEYNGKDYSSELANIDNLKVMDFDFPQIGVSSEIAEVYKSDFLRWHLLSTHGGGWSDMDILYIKPLSELISDGRMINGDESEIDTAIIFQDLGYHPIGFYLSSPNNLFFAKIFEESKDSFSETDYQSVGAHLLNRIYPNIDAIRSILPMLNIVDLKAKTVYPYLPNEINKIFSNSFFERIRFKRNITDDTIGIHWYNGSNISKQYMIDYENDKSFKGMIGKFIKKII